MATGKLPRWTSNYSRTRNFEDLWQRTISVIIVIASSASCDNSRLGLSSAKMKENRIYNATHLLDQLLTGYDNRLRPGFQGPALVVDVNLNIRSLGPISEMDMAYQMDCYFRQSWIDRRLEFNGTLKILPVAIHVLDRLWKPDTHFLNGKDSYLHMVTSPNKLLRINQDGRILYSMRLTIKATCPMHLEKFPMDTQTCPLQFGSHGYGVEDVQYIWTFGPSRSIKIAPDMTLSQFDLIGFPHGNDTSRQFHRGHLSLMWVNFELQRHTGYFIINVYIPCSMLVVISWVGFWINREATSDRIALGVTTVLTMAFLGIDNRRDLPKVSYSTALDYYVGMCFAFVLLTIIQFAGVHFHTKHGSGEDLEDLEEEDDEDDEEEEGGEEEGQMENDGEGEEEEGYEEEEDGVEEKGNRGGMRSKGRHAAIQRYNNFHGLDSYNSRPPLRRDDSLRGSRPSSAHASDAIFPSTGLNKRKMAPRFWPTLAPNSRAHRSGHHQPRSTGMSAMFGGHQPPSSRGAKQDGVNSVSRIDRVARVLFPVGFLVFNTIYWHFYMKQTVPNVANRTL